MMTRSACFWLAACCVATAILTATPTIAKSTFAWAGAVPGPLPPEVTAHFTPDDVARGRAYMVGRYRLYAVGILLQLLVLSILVFTPASAAVRNLAVRISPAHPAVATAIYIALVVAGFELLTLPLGYYSGFVREHAFGLSTQTATAWLADRLKGMAIALALTVPLGCLLTFLWRRYPGRWVLPAWSLCTLVVVVLVALAPVLIDPLFNTTQPLRDVGLRQRLLTLADRAGIPVDQVYETDASRRTTKGNAYFTGLGATKRIVLYDTLVATNDPAAIELVVAHEMGHWKHAHIWKGVALSAAGMWVLLWCAAKVIAWAGARRALHLAGPADVAGLPLFLLVIFVMNVAALPVQNAVSRYFERQADWTSLELTRDPPAFIRSEVNLARSNRADLNPSRLVVWLMYTHPPVAERIRAAETFAKTHPQPVAHRP